MSPFDQTLREFLRDAASKDPTPGGGSVSALTAALAAAMVAMVANLTLGKRGYEEAQPVSEHALVKAEAAIAELEQLSILDMEAFEQVMAAWRLPSETPGQKEDRLAAIGAAAENASQVPLRICRCCIDILTQSASLAPAGTKSAISDVGVGAFLAEAALRAAMLSVDANLGLIEDESVRSSLVREKEELLSSADRLKHLALRGVGQRL